MAITQHIELPKSGFQRPASPRDDREIMAQAIALALSTGTKEEVVNQQDWSFLDLLLQKKQRLLTEDYALQVSRKS